VLAGIGSQSPCADVAEHTQYPLSDTITQHISVCMYVIL